MYYDHMGFKFVFNGSSCLKRWAEVEKKYFKYYYYYSEEKTTGIKVNKKTYDATYQQDYEGDISVDRKKVIAYFRQAKLIEDSPKVGDRVPTRLEIPKDLV